MKKIILISVFCFPYFLMAQKGIIIPDVKPAATATTKEINDGTKIWIMDSYLVDCADSSSKCYVIKENGINKTISQYDVFDFIFEEGYKYTLQVKEELKPPPINAFSGIYNYTVLKIISKKQALPDASSIPVVSKYQVEEKSAEIPISTEKKVFYTNPESASTVSDLTDEIFALKKQIKELKKQMETMQLQLDMQFQLFQNKK